MINWHANVVNCVIINRCSGVIHGRCHYVRFIEVVGSLKICFQFLGVFVSYIEHFSGFVLQQPIIGDCTDVYIII